MLVPHGSHLLCPQLLRWLRPNLVLRQIGKLLWTFIVEHWPRLTLPITTMVLERVHSKRHIHVALSVGVDEFEILQLSKRVVFTYLKLAALMSLICLTQMIKPEACRVSQEFSCGVLFKHGAGSTCASSSWLTASLRQHAALLFYQHGLISFLIYLAQIDYARVTGEYVWVPTWSFYGLRSGSTNLSQTIQACLVDGAQALLSTASPTA